MTRGKKILLGLTAGAAALAVLLLALALLAPKLIDSEALKSRIVAAVSQKAGGEIRYSGVEISYFPLPYLEIDQAGISIPDRVEGTLESLRIYPELLPLLTGRLLIAELRLAGPDLSLNLPARPEKDGGEATDFEEILWAVLAPLSRHTPELKLLVEEGRLTLSEDGRPLLTSRDLSLELALSSRGPGSILAALRGAIPHLAIFRGDKEVVLGGKKVRGTLRIDEKEIEASITELKLDRPELGLSGKFLMTRRAPRLSLDLKGREVDVESIRDAALALLGDISVTRNIFDIVRGGKVPRIHFHTEGDSLADLGKPENILIRGRIEDGRIFIPGIELLLEETDGDVVISEGILEGKDLDARLGDSRGRDGTLKVGLIGGDAPFHLDLAIEADLSQLPPILERAIDNRAFVGELRRILHFAGRGKGRLVLGESLKSMSAKVDVSEFQFSADYRRLPYPIEVSRGRFFFAENLVRIENLGGKVGKSSFSGFAASFQWKGKPHLEISSGRFGLDTKELFPWLSSFSLFREHLSDIEELEGSVELSKVNIKGPLFEPENWHFETAGRVKGIVADTKIFPRKIEFAKGEFEADRKKLSFQNVEARALDAEVDMAGVLEGFPGKLDRVDLTLNGRIGADFLRGLRDHFGLSPDYALHAPLAVQDARLGWKSGGELFSFEGNLVIRDGPSVSADILRTPESLTVNHLSVRDERSRATSSLSLGKTKLDLKFSGNLDQKTLDDIFVSNKFSGGRLQGDIEVNFRPDKPSLSRAQGDLEGENILITLNPKKTLSIDGIAVTALDDHISIKKASLSLLDHRLQIAGGVDIRPEGYLIDLDASTDDIEWSALEKIFEGNGERKSEEGDSSWKLPFLGEIRLKADSFGAKGYTWSPIEAEISIAKDWLSIEVNRAELCGLSTPGVLIATPRGLSLDFQLTARGMELAPTYACLTDNRVQMTGSFDLSAKIEARGRADALADSARGAMTLVARKGRITRHKLFSRVLEVINVTEIYKGKLPSWKSTGFAYDTMTARGRLEGDKFRVEEFFLDGETLDVVGDGVIDLGRKKIDAKLLVAPLKTVDTIVKNIPVVNYILAGSLISIPVSVEGDIEEPGVTILSPSAIGSGFLKLIERTLKAPVKLIEPLVPEKLSE